MKPPDFFGGDPLNPQIRNSARLTKVRNAPGLCFFISPSVRFPFLANGYSPRECWSPIWMAEAGIHVILARHWAGTECRIMSHCDAWRGAGLCHIAAGHSAPDYVTLWHLVARPAQNPGLCHIVTGRSRRRCHITESSPGPILPICRPGRSWGFAR